MNLRDLQLQSACTEGTNWVCKAFPILRKGGEVERAVFLNKLLSYRGKSSKIPKLGGAFISHDTLIGWADWFLSEVPNEPSKDALMIVARELLGYDPSKLFNEAAKHGLNTRYPAFAEELLNEVPEPGAKKTLPKGFGPTEFELYQLSDIFRAGLQPSSKAYKAGADFAAAYHKLVSGIDGDTLDRAKIELDNSYTLCDRISAFPEAKRLEILRAIYPSDLRKKKKVAKPAKKKESECQYRGNTPPKQALENITTPAGVVQ